LAIATAAPAQATWQPTDQAEFGRSWREDSPAPVAAGSAEHPVRDAVLLGELRDRGVAMLLTADGALHAAGRLRVGRPPPRIVDAVGAMLLRMSFRPSAECVLTGEPVEESWLREIPELPLTARPPVRIRTQAAVLLLAAFVGVPLAMLVLADLYEQATVVVFGGQLVFAGVTRLLSYIRLDARQLEVSGPVRTHIVPWARLHGVRQDGDLLLLAWEPAVVIRVGPFEDPAARTESPPWPDRARQLGAAMLLQRRRALLGGLPGRTTSSRFSPATVVLLAYLVVMVAALYRWHH
jgi:hypothetical protein